MTKIARVKIAIFVQDTREIKTNLLFVEVYGATGTGMCILRVKTISVTAIIKKLMKLNFVDLFSKVIVVNSVLLLLFFGLYYESILAKDLPLLAKLVAAINGVVFFLYPVSILFKRTKVQTYNFIKSWWHYIALTATFLYWINWVIILA